MTRERTPEQIREHYEIERELADRLRSASKQERRVLYSVVYDELFRRVPHHPLLTRKVTLEERAKSVSAQSALVRRFLDPGCTFMEIGPGDCSLAFEVARFVKEVYALDVSEELARSSKWPENFHLIISDGSAIPVPESSVDVAYSASLMEHLHPDDALDQLSNIHRALTLRGVYICITPNRLTGPHDISKQFDQVATGLHLREYTATELVTIFKVAGFSKLQALVGGRGLYALWPVYPVVWIERMLSRLPRRTVSRWWPLRKAVGSIRVVGTK